MQETGLFEAHLTGTHLVIVYATWAVEMIQPEQSKRHMVISNYTSIHKYHFILAKPTIQTDDRHHKAIRFQMYRSILSGHGVKIQWPFFSSSVFPPEHDISPNLTQFTLLLRLARNVGNRANMFPKTRLSATPRSKANRLPIVTNVKTETQLRGRDLQRTPRLLKCKFQWNIHSQALHHVKIKLSGNRLLQQYNAA